MGLQLLPASSFVFNPANKTIDFSAVSGFTIAGLQLIRNENIVLYGPAQPYASLSINGSVVTLGSGVSTTGMNVNDPLTIYYDDGLGASSVTVTNFPATQPVSGTVTANVQGGNTTAVKVDGSAVTQPVSGIVTANMQAGGTALTVTNVNSVNRLNVALPPNAQFVWDVADYGYYFATGIALAITGGVADNDTTAIAAGDIVGLNMFYS